MADRPIDREAWARLIAELIAGETRGKKATFARLVGVDPKTIGNWLAGSVEVSEQSVRRIAAALDRRPMDLLVAVGYYREDEVARPPEQTDADVDEAIELVATDSRLTPQKKREIIDMILDRRDRARAAEIEETRRLIELFRGR